MAFGLSCSPTLARAHKMIKEVTMMTDAVSSTMRTPTHRTAAAMKDKAKSMLSNRRSRSAAASGTGMKIN